MSGSNSASGRSTRIAIVGGGAAGALVAANLLRSGDADVEVTVIEPRAEIGLGVAYSTPDPWHRLNVPAISMSALADDTDHFHRWANIAPEAFARRVDYGRYLRSVLAETVAAAPGRLRHVRSVAERVRPEGAGVRVTLAGGEPIDAAAVVLATGVETPMALPAPRRRWPATRGSSLDPWPPGSLDHIADGETIAILGTSLTAIDVAGSILTRHPAHASSRSRATATCPAGTRIPGDHGSPSPPSPSTSSGPGTTRSSRRSRGSVGSARTGAARWTRSGRSARTCGSGWTRPLRRSFVDRYRHVFDIHRHRVAAEIARDLDAWIRDGPAVGARGVGRAGRPDARRRVADRRPTGRRIVDRRSVGRGPDRGRRRAQHRPRREPAPGGRDRGRAPAAGAARDLDRQRSGDVPPARRERGGPPAWVCHRRASARGAVGHARDPRDPRAVGDDRPRSCSRPSARRWGCRGGA